MSFEIDNFWNLVGAVASIAQIATLTAAIVVIVRAKRRWNEVVKRVTEHATGAKPAVIAIGIGGNIQGAVEANLQELLPESKAPLAVIERDHFLKPSEMYDVLRDLVTLKQKLMDQGVTVVHLFYRGPVTLAMGIGAVLDNWVPVNVYELDKESGKYRLNLTLDKGAVFDLDVVEDVLTEGEQAVLKEMQE